MNKTRIPYATVGGATGLSWPIVTGCSGVDERGKALSCQNNCWARGIYKRFDREFKPAFHPEKLAEPLHRKKPARILPAFTGDLFDAYITDEQIAAVFGVMAACSQSTFLVLTKQAERMGRWFKWVTAPATVEPCVPDPLLICADAALKYIPGPSREFEALKRGSNARWPLANVWLGVSATCQKELDDRSYHLEFCPAQTRWLSVEPLLNCIFRVPRWADWIVTAAESGPKARSCKPEWVRSVRDLCGEARIRFMLKDQTGFPLLDGKTYAEYPR